jgi:hypothetical protein
MAQPTAAKPQEVATAIAAANRTATDRFQAIDDACTALAAASDDALEAVAELRRVIHH